VVLGIRPDLIRASLVLRQLQERAAGRFVFIWSGQHYSDNLKDVFLRELGIPAPDVELGASGSSDAETVAAVITGLGPVLADLRPAATVFLGDTNTVMGSLAAAQLNIPVVHIEGCMRSYDWRMPEEKYRTTIDHLSDVIYTYFDEYKAQGLAEGLNPDNILVVQNLIVDVLDHYYFRRGDYFHDLAGRLLPAHGLTPGDYVLMTAHRRENVEDPHTLQRILDLVGAAGSPVHFPASYRTQKNLARFGLALPDNVRVVDPVGYEEFLALMVNARGVATDSGTVVEETAVLGVPSLQMRAATERPQVYDCGSSVKYDPSNPDGYDAADLWRRVDVLRERSWQHGLGDGRASERIVDDLLRRLDGGTFRGHEPERSHLGQYVARAREGDRVG
jgi:UDP-N-acetylglucosamine 2-epimerase